MESGVEGRGGGEGWRVEGRKEEEGKGVERVEAEDEKEEEEEKRKQITPKKASPRA